LLRKRKIDEERRCTGEEIEMRRRRSGRVKE